MTHTDNPIETARVTYQADGSCTYVLTYADDTEDEGTVNMHATAEVRDALDALEALVGDDDWHKGQWLYFAGDREGYVWTRDTE